MLKEVGSSGQISLGKKYAGQLFDLEVRPDGCIVMHPVKIVSAATVVNDPLPDAPPTPLASGAGTRAWAVAHAADIDQYNAWASQREPYSQRVRRWRADGA